LTQPRPLTTAEIQHELLDDRTVLLEYRLGDKRSWLWMVTRTAVHSIELPPRKQIDDAARRAYGLLTARQPRSGESQRQRTVRVTAADLQWRQQGDALGRMLLGQAAARMGTAWRGKRLVIVAADTLEYLPFSCLPDPLDPRRLLVHGHEIVNVPSASVLSVIRQQLERPRAASKTLAIFADPVFEANDPRVSLSAGTGALRFPSRVRDADEGMRSVVDDASPVGDTRAPKLTRLPFSRQEAAAIAALVPASDRLEATGFRATRALATSGDLAGFRIVHFATHGFLNSEHPGLSGLVLSLVRPDGSAQDGFLRLNDIYNLHLSADVVVLSACQTALGKEIRGEGIVGLTRGFMYAGTPRVVASLWQVDDLATAELMRLFYDGMLTRRLPPAAALRAAQRSLAAQPRWSSPFYWSGFVLQGDWK
jgi:CHAT domain-containing protein